MSVCVLEVGIIEIKTYFSKEAVFSCLYAKGLNSCLMLE